MGRAPRFLSIIVHEHFRVRSRSLKVSIRYQTAVYQTRPSRFPSGSGFEKVSCYDWNQTSIVFQVRSERNSKQDHQRIKLLLQYQNPKSKGWKQQHLIGHAEEHDIGRVSQ